MTETAITDPTAELIPDGAELTAIELTADPWQTGIAETRRVDLLDLTPADDRLATRIAGAGQPVSAIAAMTAGGPLALMTAWMIAGRHAGHKADPAARLEERFNGRVLRDAHLQLIVDTPDPDPPQAGAASEDPTEPPPTA